MWSDSVISVIDWIKETKNDDLRRVKFLDNLGNGKTILDIGTGNGNFLSEIAKIAKLVVGIEPEKRLRESFEERNLKVFESLEEIETKFEIVTMFHVLEHVADPIKFLISAKNKINKDGLLVIKVPNLNDAHLYIYNFNTIFKFY